MIADELLPEFITVDSFADALLASLVMAAVSILLETSPGRATTTNSPCAS